MKVELGIERLMSHKKMLLGFQKARKIRGRKAGGKVRMECNKPRRKLKATISGVRP